MIQSKEIKLKFKTLKNESDSVNVTISKERIKLAFMKDNLREVKTDSLRFLQKIKIPKITRKLNKKNANII